MSSRSPAADAPPRRPTIRLGRLGGVEIEVHASMVVLALLLVWAGAVHLLPAQEGAQAYTRGEFWLLAAAGTLALLLSVVAHEMSHLLVARWRGLRVERLTLFFHAGHSPHGDQARSPFEELLIAAIGPLVTIVIAAGSLAAASALGEARHVVPVLEFCATTNFVLLLAHLLPGQPLDGGRILQAIAWGMTGDRHRGMRWSGRIGIAFSAVLAAACVVGIATSGLGTGWALGLVLALALALQGAGAARMGRLRERLAGLCVRQAMQPAPPVLSRITSVAEVLGTRDPKGDEAWLVEIGGRLGGLVTLEQLLRVPEDERHQTPIGQVAVRLERQHVLSPGMELESGLQRLLGEQLPFLPVVADGMLAGVLRRDVVFAIVDVRR